MQNRSEMQISNLKNVIFVILCMRDATYLICRLLLYSMMFNMIGKRPSDVRIPVMMAIILRGLTSNNFAQKSSAEIAETEFVYK